LLEQQSTTPRLYDFSSYRSLKRCLEKGIGVSLLPDVSAREELAAGSLVKLPWDSGTMETDILMIWHADKWCSPVLEHFMNVARTLNV
jgi:DNA-binding transcriptional LysR family regulator